MTKTLTDPVASVGGNRAQRRHPDQTPAHPDLERQYSPAEFGEVTGTTERLARRLIAERRIRFVKVGRYVRIPESAIAEFLAAGTVEAVR